MTQNASVACVNNGHLQHVRPVIDHVCNKGANLVITKIIIRRWPAILIKIEGTLFIYRCKLLWSVAEAAYCGRKRGLRIYKIWPKLYFRSMCAPLHCSIRKTDAQHVLYKLQPLCTTSSSERIQLDLLVPDVWACICRIVCKDTGILPIFMYSYLCICIHTVCKKLLERFGLIVLHTICMLYSKSR